MFGKSRARFLPGGGMASHAARRLHVHQLGRHIHLLPPPQHFTLAAACPCNAPASMHHDHEPLAMNIPPTPAPASAHPRQ